MNRADVRKVVPFVGIDEVEGEKPTVLTVPGHDGRSYSVKLNRGPRLVYLCGCRWAGHSVCYHGMAAVTKVAMDAGWKVSWCRGRKDAERLANMGGRVLSLTSQRSGKVAWAVIKGGLVQVANVVVAGRGPSIVPPTSRKALGLKAYPPLTSHRDKGGLLVWMAVGQVRVGKNVYYRASEASRGRLSTLMNRLAVGGKVEAYYTAVGGIGYRVAG